MNKYQTIELTADKSVSTIWLNRPEVRNAFNVTMVKELTESFEKLGRDNSVRIIVIRGRGKTFCAGADLNWMLEAVNYSREENYREAMQLSQCFYRIYSCPKPVIALVHGASTGGANGLVAASDIALSADDTVFTLSEVKIGLVPAVISPYIIKRIGEFPARELMLTAKRIHGREAAERGLVNHSYPDEELDQELEQLIEQLLQGGPEALRITKELVFDVSNNLTLSNTIEKTAGIIAEIRASGEGQEGMAAFLEKRKPRWTEVDQHHSG
jgi:methylglutaconyl-CoA hydratase